MSTQRSMVFRMPPDEREEIQSWSLEKALSITETLRRAALAFVRGYADFKLLAKIPDKHDARFGPRVGVKPRKR